MLVERDLLTLFVHLRSYEQYYKEQKEFAEKYIQDMAMRSLSAFGSLDDSVNYWRKKADHDPWFHDQLFCPPWRYNDIVAFVKIYYDGGSRILANIYYPNKRVSRQLKRKSFFYQCDFQMLLLELSNKEIRNGINSLIEELDEFFNKRKWHLEYDKELISCIDFKKLIRSSLPIRIINFDDTIEKSQHDKLVALVDNMLELQKKHHEARMERDKELYERQIKVVDAQIDRLVYDLYGLTEEEVKVVEGERR